MLDLLKELQADLGTALIFITHDMGVIAELCDRVVVMYAGEVVEDAPVNELFQRPQHPYTAALLKASPEPDAVTEEMFVIEGTVPAPADFPHGCRFHSRCGYAKNVCARAPVELYKIAEERYSRCLRVDEFDHTDLPGSTRSDATR